MVIKTTNLCKFYGEGPNMVKALDNVNINVERGELIGVVGKSGSGKSTLLNMLGALDRPTSGSIEIGGQDISKMNDEQLTGMRRSKIGFIFQNYNLIPVLNVYENIVMPIQLDGQKPDTQYIRSILDALEISNKMSSLPASLSGGQQQRVAIARALANRPEIVLADEPTGNLDESMGEGVVKMLKYMNKEFNQTIIVVTHDQDVADQMNRNIRVADGRVSS
ncbi:MAG: ABC transporter ATP-binding protein [Ruminococcus sp.]|nr:ABC transporter ATP-binding protein [Ruminococcus sp.]